MNIGDKVKCIDPGTNDFIKSGEVYTVGHITDTFVYLIDFPYHGFFPNRFELVNQQVDAEKAIHKLEQAHKAYSTSSVSSPSHYNTGSIEVIDAIEDWKLGFNLGNAVKYIARAGKKDSSKTQEDLEKAMWYLNREIGNLNK